MLCLRRFKSLVGKTLTVVPSGPLGLGWRPYYTRLIHANGYQQRQRELAFAALRVFLRRRLDHGNHRAIELHRTGMHLERVSHGNK